jgi:hypothetical protein
MQASTDSLPGTFKIAQSTLSESLDVLNDICAITEQKIDIELQREILYYVLYICTDKVSFSFYILRNF